MKYFYFEQKLFQIGAGVISNRGSFVITKRGRFITNWGRYFKSGQVYFKSGQLFQIGAIISNRCRTTVTSNDLLLLQVGPSPSKKKCFICFNKRPFKNDVFNFGLKALSVLKIFNFLS